MTKKRRIFEKSKEECLRAERDFKTLPPGMAKVKTPLFSIASAAAVSMALMMYLETAASVGWISIWTSPAAEFLLKKVWSWLAAALTVMVDRRW